MTQQTFNAPAKINVCLEVIRRYDNGFHAIRSVMIQSSALHDIVTVTYDEKGSDVTISCNHPDVPLDEKNICTKVAHAYFEHISTRVGMHIDIVKNIPPLTGLGGGSSDGAQVLRSLNTYFDQRVPAGELIDIAASVGKDIPFFLHDTYAAEVGGAGERVTPIADFPRLSMVVVCTGGEIATPWAYGQLDEKLWFMHHTKRTNYTKAMVAAQTVDEVAAAVYNDFSFVATQKCPLIAEVQLTLRAFGACATSISGKGPTVFGIFPTQKDAQNAQKILQKKYPTLFLSVL